MNSERETDRLSGKRYKVIEYWMPVWSVSQRTKARRVVCRTNSWAMAKFRCLIGQGGIGPGFAWRRIQVIGE